MDFEEAYLLTKLGHPELAGWWGKVLGGGDIDSKSFAEDSWETVLQVIAAGKYTECYNVGDMKELDLGKFGTIHMQIADFDADELADGTGYAPMTLVMKECFNKTAYPIITGDDPYWPNSVYKAFLVNDVLQELPKIIRDNIRTVTKYTYTLVNGQRRNNVETSETIWAPSVHEVFPNETQFETAGPTYSKIFTDDDSRIKRDSVGKQNWYLRTVSATTDFLRCVRYTGALGGPTSSTTQYSAAMGFCL